MGTSSHQQKTTWTAPTKRSNAAVQNAPEGPMGALVQAAKTASPVQRLAAHQRAALGFVETSTTGTLQRAAYTVTRDIPLETHYSLKPADKGRGFLVSVLRRKYPLPPEIDALAKAEKWNNEKSDALRPEGFAKEMTDLEQMVEDAHEEYADTASGTREPEKTAEDQPMDKKKLWVPGAHVKGLRVASERGRKNNPESSITKNVTGTQDWTGAHLIKREWGGEDNMLNVVCWPDKAEKDWGEQFEEPIEFAFASRAKREIDIKVRVEKEDEAIKESDLDDVLSEARAAPDVKVNKHVLGQAAAKRMEANRGIERIPTAAHGESELGTATFGKAETTWDDARQNALNKLKRTLNGMKRAKFNDDYVPKNPDEHAESAGEVRRAEREEAAEEERYNYRPEIYDVS